MDDIQLCISGSDPFSQVPEPMFSQQTPWLHSAVPNAVRPSFLTEPMLFSISWFLLVCFCQRRASSPFQLPHQKSKYQFYHLNMLSQHTHTIYSIATSWRFLMTISQSVHFSLSAPWTLQFQTLQFHTEIVSMCAFWLFLTITTPSISTLEPKQSGDPLLKLSCWLPS